MPRYFYDADRGGLELRDTLREEISREQAQTVALIQLNETMREIANALRWLGKSEEEREHHRQVIKMTDERMGEQFRRDSEALNSRA